MTIDEPRLGKTFGRSYGTSNLIHDVPKKSVKRIAACWFAQFESPTIGTNQPCCPEVWAPCRYSHKKYSRRAPQPISSQYCKRFHVIWNHSQGGSTCETAVPQMTTEDALKSSISQHCQTVHSWDFAQWFLPLYGFHSLHIINRCTDLRRICPGPGRVLMVPWAKFGDDNTDGEWTTSMGVRQSQDHHTKMIRMPLASMENLLRWT